MGDLKNEVAKHLTQLISVAYKEPGPSKKRDLTKISQEILALIESHMSVGVEGGNAAMPTWNDRIA